MGMLNNWRGHQKSNRLKRALAALLISPMGNTWSRHDIIVLQEPFLRVSTYLEAPDPRIYAWHAEQRKLLFALRGHKAGPCTLLYFISRGFKSPSLSPILRYKASNKIPRQHDVRMRFLSRKNPEYRLGIASRGERGVSLSNEVYGQPTQGTTVRKLVEQTNEHRQTQRVIKPTLCRLGSHRIFPVASWHV